MGNRLTGLLMVLLVVLGAGLAAELFLGGGDAEPQQSAAGGDASQARPVAGGAGAVPEPPPFGLAGIENLSDTVERPLFEATRRPPVEAPVVAAEGKPVEAVVKPKAPLNVVLSAVVINGDSKVALLRNARDGKTTRVYEGESVDGWALSAIGPDRVSLTNGSETQDVELRKFEPPRLAALRQPQAGNTQNRVRNARNRARSTQDRARRLQQRRRELEAQLQEELDEEERAALEDEGLEAAPEAPDGTRRSARQRRQRRNRNQN